MLLLVVVVVMVLLLCYCRVLKRANRMENSAHHQAEEALVTVCCRLKWVWLVAGWCTALVVESINNNNNSSQYRKTITPDDSGTTKVIGVYSLSRGDGKGVSEGLEEVCQLIADMAIIAAMVSCFYCTRLWWWRWRRCCCQHCWLSVFMVGGFALLSLSFDG